MTRFSYGFFAGNKGIMFFSTGFMSVFVRRASDRRILSKQSAQCGYRLHSHKKGF